MVRNARRLQKQDQDGGFVMITAIALLFVIALLSAWILKLGEQTNRTTGRGRARVQALHVAEAGVHRAIARLPDLIAAQAFSGGPVTIPPGTLGEGGFTGTITKLARSTYRIDTIGTVGTGAGLGAKRRLSVTMAPPVSFENALLSTGDVNTKNNDQITGDVWANGNVEVYSGNTVTGNVVAATGWVSLDNNSTVTGNATSGGYDAGGVAINVSTGATIGGNGVAASTAPDCSDDVAHAQYKVNVVGSIGGTVTTWGTKTGAGPTGTVTTDVCTPAQQAKTIPPFTYNPNNYDPTPLEFTSAASFNTWLAANLSDIKGTFYISDPSPNQTNRIDLSNVTITGDATFITNTPIFTNGVIDASGLTDLLVQFISTYTVSSGACDVNQDDSECAIHIKNNFDNGSCATAFIAYAPNGPVAIKNNMAGCGAVYSNNIQIKNNQTFTFDERIKRLVGFGPTTLEIQRWAECPTTAASC